MQQTDFDIDGKIITGFVISLQKAPLVLARGSLGFVMCGYLSIDVANRLGVPAGMVSGVSTVEDLLKAPLRQVSEAAVALGVTVGMSGRDALKIMA